MKTETVPCEASREWQLSLGRNWEERDIWQIVREEAFSNFLCSSGNLLFGTRLKGPGYYSVKGELRFPFSCTQNGSHLVCNIYQCFPIILTWKPPFLSLVYGLLSLTPATLSVSSMLLLFSLFMLLLHWNVSLGSLCCAVSSPDSALIVACCSSYSIYLECSSHSSFYSAGSTLSTGFILDMTTSA